MFSVKWTDEATAFYNELKAKARSQALAKKERGDKKASKIMGLYRQVSKTVNLLKNNPRHPGLNTHEYTSILNPVNAKEKVFEAYAQNNTAGAYRVFWCYGPGKRVITIISITPHS